MDIEQEYEQLINRLMIEFEELTGNKYRAPDQHMGAVEEQVSRMEPGLWDNIPEGQVKPVSWPSNNPECPTCYPAPKHDPSFCPDCAAAGVNTCMPDEPFPEFGSYSSSEPDILPDGQGEPEEGEPASAPGYMLRLYQEQLDQYQEMLEKAEDAELEAFSNGFEAGVEAGRAEVIRAFRLLQELVK